MNAVTKAPTEMTAAVKLDSLIQEAADSLKVRAQSMVITSDAEYMIASDFGADIKERHGQTEADRVKLKAPFLNGCNGIDAHFRAPLKTLTEALEVVKQRMLAWDTEKKRLAKIEADRQAEIARLAKVEADRKEREALEAIKAQERIQQAARDAELARERAAREEAEAKARSEARAREAADARAAGDRAKTEAAERAQADAEAIAKRATEDAAAERQKAIDARRAQLKAERDTTAAVQAMDSANQAASEAVATKAAPVLTHVAGNRRRTIWKAVVKPGAEIPRKYLVLDEKLLDEVVQRYKEGAQEFLGDWVTVTSEETLAIGSKK